MSRPIHHQANPPYSGRRHTQEIFLTQCRSYLELKVFGCTRKYVASNPFLHTMETEKVTPKEPVCLWKPPKSMQQCQQFGSTTLPSSSYPTSLSAHPTTTSNSTSVPQIEFIPTNSSVSHKTSLPSAPGLSGLANPTTREQWGTHQLPRKEEKQ